MEKPQFEDLAHRQVQEATDLNVNLDQMKKILHDNSKRSKRRLNKSITVIGKINKIYIAYSWRVRIESFSIAIIPNTG